MATQVPTRATSAVGVDEVGALNRPEGRWRPSPTVAYVARRVGLFLFTLWGSISASFLFFRLIPGDPIDALIAQLASRGQYTQQEQSQQITEYYQEAFGLNGSLLEQYWRYMERVVFHFDFGPSLLSYPNPATDLIFRALPWTLGLIGTATLIGWLIGVVAGTFVG
jgi:peptide/nickel transport system permease protein